MVREGADEDTLDVALGHIPGTAFPGEAGNVGVAGHRDTLFRRLGEIARNDVIQMQSLSASYVYRVDDIAIVKPETVSVSRSSPVIPSAMWVPPPTATSSKRTWCRKLRSRRRKAGSRPMAPRLPVHNQET